MHREPFQKGFNSKNSWSSLYNGVVLHRKGTICWLAMQDATESRSVSKKCYAL